jgi:hypothetical protein
MKYAGISFIFVFRKIRTFHPSLENIYVNTSVYVSVEPSKLDSGDDWLQFCPGY